MELFYKGIFIFWVKIIFCLGMLNIRNLLGLFRYVMVKFLEKGEILIERGLIRKEVYYIWKGLICSFIMDDMEDEIIF